MTIEGEEDDRTGIEFPEPRGDPAELELPPPPAGSAVDDDQVAARSRLGLRSKEKHAAQVDDEPESQPE